MKRALSLLLALTACSDPTVSQVMLVVDGETEVRRATRSVVVRITGGSRERNMLTNEVFREELPVTPTSGWGVRIALAPDQRDWRRLYEAEAVAYDGPNGTGNVVARTRAVSGYVRGETRTLRLLLQDDCLNEECEPSLTCRNGACVDPFIPPDQLRPPDPDAGGDSGTDAGVDSSVRCSDNTDCDDGIPCTTEACIDGVCHFTADSAMCDDGERCTTDRCDLMRGCIAINNNLSCDDGVFCNGNDTCASGACSLHDGNACGGLTCNADAMICEGCGRDADCPNGQRCDSGSCTCPSATEDCTNGRDDDCDGLSDCDDPNCEDVLCNPDGRVCFAGRCECTLVESCGDGVTNDCDDAIDEGCGPGVESDCGDGVDNNMDGPRDCADPTCDLRTCGGLFECRFEFLRCCAIDGFDGCGGGDEDCDSFVDEDCFEDCSNGLDDDSDGDTDCEDEDCFAADNCFEFLCADTLDNDGDGARDCDDEDCFDDPVCDDVPDAGLDAGTFPDGAIEADGGVMF
ncbi:MAG: hypothetical protein AAGE52_30160 [Myxococcota bacterium]